MSDRKRLLINIRLGAWHLQSSPRFGWLRLHRNMGHVRNGEFRSKPEWRPFAVYRFFGMVR